jgi:hypothetical protein
VATGKAGFIAVPTVWRMLTQGRYFGAVGEQLAFRGKVRLVASMHDEVIWSKASNAIHFSISESLAEEASCAILQPAGEQVLAERATPSGPSPPPLTHC